MVMACKLPDEVVSQILDCCCNAARLDHIDLHAWSTASCSDTFANLDRLRRVSKAFNERISCSPAFLQLLRCEQLRAFERNTWTGKGSLSQKKLPKFFTLPFAATQQGASSSTSPQASSSNSSGTGSSGTAGVSKARFHIRKFPKHPQWFVVEAQHKDSTPEQV
jgi:hypothetical protein